jgi:hypothetical protein
LYSISPSPPSLSKLFHLLHLHEIRKDALSVRSTGLRSLAFAHCMIGLRFDSKTGRLDSGFHP